MKNNLILLFALLGPLCALGQTDSLSLPSQIMGASDTLASEQSSTSVVNQTTDSSYAATEVDTLSTESSTTSQDSFSLANSVLATNQADTLTSLDSLSGSPKNVELNDTAQKAEAIDQVSFNTKKIHWNSSQNRSLQSNSTPSTQGYSLVTDRGKSITLIGPTRQWTFDIVSKESGSFVDSSIGWDVIFNIKYNETYGKFEVKNNDGVLSYILDFRETNPNGLFREFIITETNIEQQ
ncbi:MULTISPECIES: hypothetical protein [unclassified Imperialibacter]|uniref:hypothetical protein n=1 Tax=unclassified Imperialibacter TaxID=2629706 RepID=UPI001259C320|nr:MULTISPECIES: hypothetical protein [unclassified Imperialibacter]CAD5265052.1 exported hypothetical protein [Imperialibacter sp. 89]CAD5269944.1 exported hypothetical protein [Imperialibacter sp. 75]VVT09538.1 exported hypothetical protein [Imperialibacter sp. EC-SDR9]